MWPTSKTLIILANWAIGSLLVAVIASALYGISLMVSFLIVAAACGSPLLLAPNRDPQKPAYIMGLATIMVIGGLALWALQM